MGEAVVERLSGKRAFSASVTGADAIVADDDERLDSDVRRIRHRRRS